MHFSYVPENKWQIRGALIDLNIFLHFMTYLVLSQKNWKYDNCVSRFWSTLTTFENVNPYLTMIWYWYDLIWYKLNKSFTFLL